MHSTTVHYNYNALCGGLHEICSTAPSFNLRCETVTLQFITLLAIAGHLLKHITTKPYVYVDTITCRIIHQEYTEKNVSLWIKIKQKNLKTCIDYIPTCIRFIRNKLIYLNMHISTLITPSLITEALCRVTSLQLF